MEFIWRILNHSIFALFLAVLSVASALSGRLSMALSRVLLFLAWCIAMTAILHTTILPNQNWKMGAAAIITIVLALLGYWMTRHDVPNIVIDRYTCTMATFPARLHLQWWAMHLYLLNDSKSSQQHGEPANVTARIDFYNNDMPKPEYLFHLYGRWADGSYPNALTPKALITPTTFPIGFSRDLDICLKYPADADCYGINNESWDENPIDLKLQRYRLNGIHLLAKVRLRGPFVDRSFQLKFKNDGAGGGFSDLQYLAIKNNWFRRLLALFW
jgi:hypothetical protein